MDLMEGGVSVSHDNFDAASVAQRFAASLNDKLNDVAEGSS